jgi:hypothetical protein
VYTFFGNVSIFVSNKPKGKEGKKFNFQIFEMYSYFPRLGPSTLRYHLRVEFFFFFFRLFFPKRNATPRSFQVPKITFFLVFFAAIPFSNSAHLILILLVLDIYINTLY